MDKYTPFMKWLIETAEEKIIEHRFLQNEFSSHEEFVVFTIIWLRVYKNLYQKIKENSEINKTNEKISIDNFIENFYKNQQDKYLGMTINAISRESEIPRSTVKRIIEKLIIKNLVQRNSKLLIIPTSKVRERMKGYRKYIFKSNKKNSKMFFDLNLENLFDEDSTF